jgi:PIN domain nuclease of toxin-antitoxin system
VILLDTHVLLWLCLEPGRLSRAATTAIRKALAAGGLAIASITLWEVAMMVRLGRLVPRGTPESWLAELVARSGVIVKEITPAIATLATQFSDEFPADPADRLIAATARAEGVVLVTRDARLRRSGALTTTW